MTVYIFTGPTLSPSEARHELDAVYLPPAAHGDVYRAALTRPQAIGIIDGYFERVPSVWHKEILWAMKEGIHVFGSASMGALRAAELEAFGMEGVGVIFAAYRDGVLQDDDEVAVAHGPVESGYLALSEALVNIRATLAAAERERVITHSSRMVLEQIAKGLFYPERSYPCILQRAAEQGLPAQQLAALRAWLPYGRVNQKREDALAMLHLMRERLQAGLRPKEVSYHFEHTEAWNHVCSLAGELVGDAESVLTDALLDELRLEGDAYTHAAQEGLARFLAVAEGSRQGMAVSPEALQEMVDVFRRERGLFEPEDVQRWLAEQRLSLDEFRRLMEDEAVVRAIKHWAEPDMTRYLVDVLRVNGKYPGVLARARDKQRWLTAYGLEEPGLADAGLTEPGLWRWYFEDRCQRPTPSDIAQYARSVGFSSATAFRRAVLREFCFVGGCAGTTHHLGETTECAP